MKQVTKRIVNRVVRSAIRESDDVASVKARLNELSSALAQTTKRQQESEELLALIRATFRARIDVTAAQLESERKLIESDFVRLDYTNRRDAALAEYSKAAYAPFSEGYHFVRREFISSVLNDDELMKSFRQSSLLPSGFGMGLDERAVEVPWALSRLDTSHAMLMDAGASLNQEWLLAKEEIFLDRNVLFYTLSPESEPIHRSPNFSYVFGDLRNTILKSNTFDAVACISTLEHIGMDNSLYTKDGEPGAADKSGYESAFAEIWRVLKPGGVLLLTVPYGEHSNHGWFQQFDSTMIRKLQSLAANSACEETYYRYTAKGWQTSSAQQCASAQYHDVHKDQGTPPDKAAAARAVACLAFTKA